MNNDQIHVLEVHREALGDLFDQKTMALEDGSIDLVLLGLGLDALREFLFACMIQSIQPMPSLELE